MSRCCVMRLTARTLGGSYGARGARGGICFAQAPSSRQHSSAGGAQIPAVPWEARNANAVSLIGNLGRDPDVRYLESGATVANTSIAVSREEEREAKPSWFSLEMWGDLAERAEGNLFKGQRVHVTGRLLQNRWQDKATGMPRERVSIRVNAINLVEGEGGPRAFAGSKSAAAHGGRFAPRGAPGAGGGAASAHVAEAQWTALFSNPRAFWDNREGKRNPRAPDFKHKETGEALWITSKTTPAWVAGALQTLNTEDGGGGTQGGAGAPGLYGTVEPPSSASDAQSYGGGGAGGGGGYAADDIPF